MNSTLYSSSSSRIHRKFWIRIQMLYDEIMKTHTKWTELLQLFLFPTQKKPIDFMRYACAMCTPYKKRNDRNGKCWMSWNERKNTPKQKSHIQKAKTQTRIIIKVLDSVIIVNCWKITLFNENACERERERKGGGEQRLPYCENRIRWKLKEKREQVKIEFEKKIQEPNLMLTTAEKKKRPETN